MANLTERQYDLIHNEGGEGYNPIRERRVQAEHEAARAAPVTVGDLLHRLGVLMRIFSAWCDARGLINTTDPTVMAERAPCIAALQREIAALRARHDAQFAAEWPREVTIERRVAWNAWARANTNITPVGRSAHEREVRYTMSELRRAVALHNLPREG